MIDFNETLMVLRAYVHFSLGKACGGLLSSKDKLPSYNISKIPICSKCLNDNQLSKYCIDFYKNLEENENQTTCPFGIRIEYSKIHTSFGFFSMIYQVEFFSSLEQKELLNQLPRKLKKIVSNSIIETKSFTYHPIKVQNLLNRFEDIVNTILAGRVYESMRALTHEILTPIQGAVNDLQHIIKKIEASGIEILETNRLEKNIMTTVQISKRISLLLSTNVLYNEQSFRKVTVHKIVDTISERHRSLTEDKKIVIKHGYNSGPKLVEAVPDQLEIVLNILIENAVKYSFSGFFDKPTIIDISYKSKSYEILEIIIESLGCLITNDEIVERRIFELGYRGKYSTDRSRKGTGSGLYIADKIMRAHNGSIKVVSREIESEITPPRAVNKFVIHMPIYQSK